MLKINIVLKTFSKNIVAATLFFDANRSQNIRNNIGIGSSTSSVQPCQGIGKNNLAPVSPCRNLDINNSRKTVYN